MARSAYIVILSILVAAPSALAGYSSYKSPYSSDSVVAPVEIRGKGIYNIVVAVQFLNEPYDQKVYKSDAYKKFMSRMKVEWGGIAISQILRADEQSMSDLIGLKGKIETKISELADRLKNKYALNEDVEVVFSVSNFFLVEPNRR